MTSIWCWPWFDLDLDVWPWPWYVTLASLMACRSIQRNNKLKQVNNHFFCTWPWPWPNDLDTQTWPRYGQDVPPYQKWSSYVKRFKSYSLNRQTHRHTDTQTHRQTDTRTDRHDRKHYLPAFAGGKNEHMNDLFSGVLIHFKTALSKLRCSDWHLNHITIVSLFYL